MAAVAHAQIFQFLRFHHNAVQLLIGADRILRRDAGFIFLVLGVEPAGVHPGILAALDVCQQVIAHHQHTAFVRDAKVAEGVLK